MQLHDLALERARGYPFAQSLETVHLRLHKAAPVVAAHFLQMLGPKRLQAGIALLRCSDSVSAGSRKSQSDSYDSYQSGTTSRGSSLWAGGNVILIATGAGKDGNILIQAAISRQARLPDGV